MPLTIQQTADTEALLLTWYQTLREFREILAKRQIAREIVTKNPESNVTAPGDIGFDVCVVRHQPSGEQLRWWIATYGFDCTERGLRVGLRGFLKIVEGRVESEKDAIRMIDYLNACIRNTRASFANARDSAKLSWGTREECDTWMLKNGYKVDPKDSSGYSPVIRAKGKAA